MYRKFNPKFRSEVLTIFAGEIYISTKKEIISTVLGSCISVCLYDSSAGIGGMNHFMLPEDTGNRGRLYTQDLLKKEELTGKAMRYGITAMEVLIGEMQKSGAKRKNFKAKIFGGGNVLVKKLPGQSIGDKNIGFARAFLKLEEIEIEGENVGNNYGRKIFFLTGQNKIFVKKVDIEPAITEERKYMEKLLELRKQGDVTVF